MLTHPTETLGLVIVDHGSKKAAANDMLLDVAAMFKRVAGTPIVEPAHMELAPPTIEQAFDKCVAQGATLVIVHPYFLSPGRHSTTDIPTLTAQAAARHPGIKFHVTQPLGLDEKIAQIMIRLLPPNRLLQRHPPPNHRLPPLTPFIALHLCNASHNNCARDNACVVAIRSPPANHPQKPTPTPHPIQPANFIIV
jgi:sirohydrochlorin ferrochelatase